MSRTWDPKPSFGANALRLARRIWREWHLGAAMDMAARVSFYFVLSCFPFLIVLAGLLGWIPNTASWYSFSHWIANYLPASAQDVMLRIMFQLSKGSGAFLSLGLLLTIWSASTGFLSLMEALTEVYGVKDERSYLKRRLIAIAATLLAAFFLMLWFALWSAGHLLVDFLSRYSVSFDEPWKLLRWLATVAMITFAVDLINYFLPGTRQPWRWITPGAALAVLCFLIASGILNLYVNHDVSRIYGTLTGLFVMMVWIYFANLSVLLGAQTDAALVDLRTERAGSGQ